MEKTEWKRIMQEEFIRMETLRERLTALSGESNSHEHIGAIRQQWLLATRKHIEAWKNCNS
jgi:hypothetical protein